GAVNVAAGVPLRVSHSPTVLSSLTTASRVPSGLNATGAFQAVVNVAAGAPGRVSHRRTGWASLAVASRGLSGLSAHALTVSGLAVKVASGAPVRASHTPRVWSSLAVASWVPSGLNITGPRTSVRMARDVPVRVSHSWAPSVSSLASLVPSGL